MSAHANPDIVDDNLVFMYDTDDGKSFKGEPTTNVMADPLPTAGWGVSNYLSSTATRTYSSENGIPHMEITNVNVDGSYPRINMANLTSTITDGFSISFEAKSSVADAQLYFALYSSGSTKTSQLATLSTEWQRFKFENLTTGFTLDDGYLRFPSSADSGTVYYIRRMQVEQKTHATPFVNGTRSATQGLIDRTGTSTIDISNASFDSNAQMTFDGTDDTINTGLFSGRNPSTDPFTIEAVVKSDITSGSRMWIDATSNGSNQRLYCAYAATGTGNPMGIQGTAWSSSGVNDTDYHHYVIVMDGSVARLYNNGEAHSTRNYTSYQIQALNIGGRNTYRWLGDIPIFKIYNRALTASEVLQNYNATKSRFA